MKNTSRLASRSLALRGAALAALLLAGADVAADDRDLLRFNTAKPYVFLILDTSGSMTLAPDGSWLPANGDDPGSKIYQAKEALYEVFSNVDDIHVGFAIYNRDELRVRGKHWLYEVDPGGGQRLTLSGGDYPATGEVLTFGKHFEIGVPGVAGACDDPLDFASERAKINRFAKLDSDGQQTTTIWLEDGGTTYRLLVSPQGSAPLGSPDLHVDFTLAAVPNCSSPPAITAGVTASVKVDLIQEFLMRDLETTPGSDEPSGGFWPWEDVESETVCGDSAPFTGGGWEGNYDSGFVSGDSDFDDDVTDDDPYCVPGNSSSCRNLLQPTIAASVAREVDVGDMVPLHWDLDNLDLLLDRLAPNRLSGVPDFRAAPYFNDVPDALGLSLKQASRRPIFASGPESPLGKAIADFRCWYRGQGTNKCSNFGSPVGWENVALLNDPEWGCRRPYLIVVGDGASSCPGESVCADVANLNSKSDIRTWVLTYAETAQSLNCVPNAGNGEVVLIEDKDSLVTELQRVLGLIREEASTFASAAAPSTQRVIDRSVYVSSFTPINARSRWDGHIDSFIKPLPLTINDEPDRTSSRFQWDAGTELEAQAPTLATALTGDLDLGRAETERRVFYSVLRGPDGPVREGEWPAARRGLFWTDDDTPRQVRYDLWRGLGIPFAPDDPLPPVGESGVDQAAQDRANTVLSKTVAIQEATIDGSAITYVLGDIFHSDPLVLGSPANTQLFAEDAEGDGTNCSAGNPGYRCFFREHQFRRKQLVVGSNDGMLHVFDAGRAAAVTDPQGNSDIRFNLGSGREIFSYMPRAVMLDVRRMAEGSSHQLTVDGPPVAADVFIDPFFDSMGPTAADREFRTVVVTGLREGGSSYFALDVTQPDTFDSDGLPVPLPGAEGYVPSCVATTNDLTSDTPSDCGPIPYGSPLWEFSDTVYDPITQSFVALDENGDGVRDLGDTWSPVTIGRIPVCEGAECNPNVQGNSVRDLWVAVFSGGMDPSQKQYDPRSPAPDDDPQQLRGDWLYMVDIETGRTVYKRQLLVEIDGEMRSAGSAPGGAAAVDTDQDGYLDRVYLGTVGGYLFRVDLELDAGDAFSLVDQSVPTVLIDPVTNDPITFTVERFPVAQSGEPIWEPKAIFSANFDNTSATTQPRAIYHEPAVVFVAQLGRYALAFGTGDREDLWSNTTQLGRFYVFVDETDLLQESALPQNESSFFGLQVNADNLDTNLLTTRPVGQKGWFLILSAKERVITKAFSLAGVTFFSSYQPNIAVSSGADPLCSKTGGSRIFIVNTTNGNAFVDVLGTRQRFINDANFVSQPYTEQGANPDVTADDDDPDTPPGPTADDLTDQLRQVMEEMKELFPSDCKFANFHIAIKTLAADTGVIFIAPVPVCMIERNWKEF